MQLAVSALFTMMVSLDDAFHRVWGHSVLLIIDEAHCGIPEDGAYSKTRITYTEKRCETLRRGQRAQRAHSSGSGSGNSSSGSGSGVLFLSSCCLLPTVTAT